MAYTNFVFAAATKFGTEDNGNWSLVDTNGDGSPDLVYIKTRDTGSGFIEVHTSRNESLFQETTNSTPSAFPVSDGQLGTFLLRDYTGDGKADLVFIKNKQGTNGHVELHIADAASNYKNFVLQTVTAFGCEDNGNWTLSDKGDLIFIKTRNTPNGKVEVHILSKACNYQTFIIQTATVFNAEEHVIYTIAPKSTGPFPHLYAIKAEGSSTGKVEISAATSASDWKDLYLATTSSGFTAGEFESWSLAHFSHQRDPDLVGIKNRRTATGKVEVYIAQPYALKPNSFLDTSKDIRLEDGHVLRGWLKRNDGSWRDATVDLDGLLGNTDGVLDYGIKGFSGSARNVKLNQTSLTAELRTKADSWQEDSIDIGDRIFNNDGAFKAVDIPVIIAIPKGQEGDFLKSLGDALKSGNLQLQVGNTEQNGSTLWHYSAGASSTLDRTGYFRTYGAEAKTSVYRIAEDSKYDIMKTEINFLSAGASVKTERLENFKLQGTYVGAEAHYNVVEGHAGALDFNLGIGVEAGIGIKDQSLDLEAGVVGVTIGRKMGISFLGSSVSIDFGVIWDTISLF